MKEGKIGIASVCEELEVESNSGLEVVIGWKNGCRKLARLGSESKNSSVVSIAGLFKVELVSNYNTLDCIVKIHVKWVRWKTGSKNG